MAHLIVINLYVVVIMVVVGMLAYMPLISVLRYWAIAVKVVFAGEMV